jgi:hypothetical protein
MTQGVNHMSQCLIMCLLAMAETLTIAPAAPCTTLPTPAIYTRSVPKVKHPTPQCVKSRITWNVSYHAMLVEKLLYSDTQHKNKEGSKD